MTSLQSLNPANIEQFVNGLLTGLVQEDNLAGVHACLSDAGSLETEVLAAVSDFKGHHYIDGVKNVGEVLEALEADIADCESMKTDWSRITAWSAIFKDKKKLAETVINNVVHNWDKLHADIDQLEADEKSANFTDMGLMVADISTSALGPVPASATTMLF